MEEDIESLCSMFWLYTEITPRFKEIVKRYVYRKAVNNMFRHRTETRLGVVTWSINKAPAVQQVS